MKLFLFFLLSSFSLFLSSSTYKVLCPGEGSTRDIAIKSAQRNALEQAIGVYVESSTKVQNYMVENDQLYSQSKGYIKSYAVLKEQENNGNWLVQIEAEVPDMYKIFKAI